MDGKSVFGVHTSHYPPDPRPQQPEDSRIRLAKRASSGCVVRVALRTTAMSLSRARRSNRALTSGKREADARVRTGDLLLTMEVPPLRVLPANRNIASRGLRSLPQGYRRFARPRASSASK
jgi:hypothetical protein